MEYSWYISIHSFIDSIAIYSFKWWLVVLFSFVHSEWHLLQYICLDDALFAIQYHSLHSLLWPVDIGSVACLYHCHLIPLTIGTCTSLRWLIMMRAILFRLMPVFIYYVVIHLLFVMPFFSSCIWCDVAVGERVGRLVCDALRIVIFSLDGYLF